MTAGRAQNQVRVFMHGKKCSLYIQCYLVDERMNHDFSNFDTKKTCVQH